MWCLLEISKKKTLSYLYLPDTPGTEHKLCTQLWTRYLILPDYYSSKCFKVALNSLSTSPAISVSCRARSLHICTTGIWAQVILGCGVLSPTLWGFEQHACYSSLDADSIPSPQLWQPKKPPDFSVCLWVSKRTLVENWWYSVSRNFIQIPKLSHGEVNDPSFQRFPNFPHFHSVPIVGLRWSHEVAIHTFYEYLVFSNGNMDYLTEI